MKISYSRTARAVHYMKGYRHSFPQNNSACTNTYKHIHAMLTKHRELAQGNFFQLSRLGMKNQKTFHATRSSGVPNPFLQRIDKVEKPNCF